MFIPGFQSIYNPLELYVDAEEGFALGHYEDGKKIFDLFLFDYDGNGILDPDWCAQCFGFHDTKYPDLQMKTKYNRMAINKQIDSNTFLIDLYFYDMHAFEMGVEGACKVDVGREFLSIPLGDGSIALQCPNGKYLDQWPGSWITPICQPHVHPEFVFQDPCTSNGICDTCKFYPEVGTVNPVVIEVLSVDWGEVNGEIITNPSIVAKDQQDNWSDEI